MNSGKLNPIPGQREAQQPMTEHDDETLTLEIPAASAGKRLDQALAALAPDFSRSQIQQWIRDGRVLVDGAPAPQRQKLLGGEIVDIVVPEPPVHDWLPEALPLDIVYEDASLLVVNKAAGMVVHPGAGNSSGTLVNALLAHAPRLAVLPRAGIVHRLDKDTSGLLVIAKTEAARLALIADLSAHAVEREYLAIVSGIVIAGGTIDAPIGRHPRERVRMAVREEGKPAVSHYRVHTRYRAHTLLSVRLESGRTHQIRVHMAHVGHPLLGDPVYGGRLQLPRAIAPDLAAALRGFKRQALHAAKLTLTHPATDAVMTWSRPVPDDMAALMRLLGEDMRRQADER